MGSPLSYKYSLVGKPWSNQLVRGPIVLRKASLTPSLHDAVEQTGYNAPGSVSGSCQEPI